MKRIKRCIPLTYVPKIQGVISGTIRQTIRVDSDYQIGDKISFHGWSGTPYRSRWSFRTPYYNIILAEPIRILPRGIMWPLDLGVVWEWDSQLINDVAVKDGIEPGTGPALKGVLEQFHGTIPKEGIEAIIIRW
jgi:hypothetical protein